MTNQQMLALVKRDCFVATFMRGRKDLSEDTLIEYTEQLERLAIEALRLKRRIVLEGFYQGEGDHVRARRLVEALSQALAARDPAVVNLQGEVV